LASKFFENRHKSLSFSDLYFIFGEVEISRRDVLDIDGDENLVPGDGNFILDVTGNVFTLISNAANVFKKAFTVLHKLYHQFGNCSFLNPGIFEEI